MHAVEGMEALRRRWDANKGEIYTIVRLSIPVSTGFLLNKLVSFVSVILVGHLGPAELAAAALGSSLINVVGNSVLAGLAGAMSTLCGQVSLISRYMQCMSVSCSCALCTACKMHVITHTLPRCTHVCIGLCCHQAYGAKSYGLVGHVWQRAMIILGLVCIPICGVLLATEKLLLLGGQTPAVAAMTAAYVRSADAHSWVHAPHGSAHLLSSVHSPRMVTFQDVMSLHQWQCF